MMPIQRNLAAVSILITIISLTAVAGLGWWNFVTLKMATRNDIREACYLATAFEKYFLEHGTLPSTTDVESFPSRLRYVRFQDGDYLYACGLYGQDLSGRLHHPGQNKPTDNERRISDFPF